MTPHSSRKSEISASADAEGSAGQGDGDYPPGVHVVALSAVSPAFPMTDSGTR